MYVAIRLQQTGKWAEIRRTRQFLNSKLANGLKYVVRGNSFTANCQMGCFDTFGFKTINQDNKLFVPTYSHHYLNVSLYGYINVGIVKPGHLLFVLNEQILTTIHF